MSKQSSGVHLSIEVDDLLEFYTNGDHIAGRVVVECNKSFALRDIEVKLRCEDYAVVTVPDSQGSHLEIEKHRFLSLATLLFPESSLRDTVEPNDDMARYTLQCGRHEYPFEFQIPLEDMYPQSFDVQGTKAGVKWYLKAAVHRGQMFSIAKREYLYFEMRPSHRLDHQITEMHSDSMSFPLKVYMPGYAAQGKTASGLLKGLLPGGSQFRRSSSINFTIMRPALGLYQDPLTINVIFELGCVEEEHLMLRKFILKLKRKTIVSVRSHSNAWRQFYSIYENNSIDKSLKTGLREIKECLDKTVISGRIPATFTNQHFDIQYKLVAEIHVASKEKPNTIRKLRFSSPIVMNPFLPVNRAVTEQDESQALPEYKEKAGAGESTVVPT